METLVRFPNHGKKQGKITKMQVPRASPLVFHFLFVDDLLLFCKVETLECEEVMKVVTNYRKVSD